MNDDAGLDPELERLLDDAWDALEDGDLRAWPIPGTLKPLHNTQPPRGEVFMSMYTLDGAPMTSDPRHALQRQVDLMAKDGLHPAGAFELEFFLLDPERGPDGKARKGCKDAARIAAFVEGVRNADDGPAL